MPKLFEHQKKIITESPRYNGLFWEMGTGKTAAAIRLVEKNATSALVVCPKSLKTNWWREIDRWRTTKPAEFEFRVMTKEEFRKSWHLIVVMNLRGLIIDEAHHHAGYKSHLHKSTVKYETKVMPDCVYLLTGTPYLSTPYNIMCLEKMLGHKARFLDYKFKFFTEVRMGGRKIPMIKPNIEPIIADIVNKIGTTITKEECLDLPAQIFKQEDFEFTNEQKKAIVALHEDPDCITPIVMFTRIHQICGGTLKGETEEFAKNFATEKLKRIKSYSAIHPKFVVVCRYNAELRMLKRHLKNARILNGATPSTERQEIIDWANTEQEAILLVNAALSEGYNLQGMNIMIFYSNGFSFKDRSQILSRIHRSGQTKKCTYIDLVVRNSVDEDVLKALKRKEDFDIAIYAKRKSY